MIRVPYYIGEPKKGPNFRELPKKRPKKRLKVTCSAFKLTSMGHDRCSPGYAPNRGGPASRGGGSIGVLIITYTILGVPYNIIIRV